MGTHLLLMAFHLHRKAANIYRLHLLRQTLFGLGYQGILVPFKYPPLDLITLDNEGKVIGDEY